MIKNTIVTIFGASFLAVSAHAAEYELITTKADFDSLVVGKKLYIDDNHVTIRKNGSIKGKFGGKQLKGAWEWRDGAWCRTLTTHSKNSDCQQWEVNGNQFRVTRERGKGKQFIYVTK